MALKGTTEKSINVMIGLVISIAIAAIFVALFLPALLAGEGLMSCVGLLRNISAIIANATGINIC